MTKLIRIVFLTSFLAFAGCAYSLQLNLPDSPIIPIDIPIETPEYKPARINFEMDISTSKGKRTSGSGKLIVNYYNDNLLWDGHFVVPGFQFYMRWISKRNGELVSYERPVFLTEARSLTQEERKALEERFIESIKQTTMKKLPDSPLKSGDVLFNLNEYKDGFHYIAEFILLGWVIHRGSRHLFAEIRGSGSGKGHTASLQGFLIIDSKTFHAVHFEFITTVENYSIKLTYLGDVTPL